ncbi:MAG TPA: protein kinase [Verrucomicrobiae bacterium]|nr:protein kinase [Verrucomicrobiae bacterium]
MNPEKTCPTCGSEIPADAADDLCLTCLGRLGFLPEPGDSLHGGLLRLGDYELLEEIARGGMGVVYRARQLSLNRIVAVKVVLHGPFSSPDFVRRFRNEAQVIAALRHPNIVAIHEIGEHQGNHFISLEFIDGKSFAELARERPLSAIRAARYVKTIAEAVEHAHQRGVLHRDLKPSNVLLDVFDQPRVTDFGLAKLVTHDQELTTTGQVLGSPNYMPPEQAMGKSSEGTVQSDVYSLGAILYELLTGRPPFQGETLQAVLAQVQDTEPVLPRRLNPATPMDLQTICLKCLQKEPARRYRSAQELADDLGRFLESKPIRARPVPLAERAWLWCRRRPLLASVGGGLVAAIVLGVSGILWEWRQAEFHAQGEIKQRLIAERDAAETRLNLYAADIAAATQAIQNGNFGLARRTLEQLRPKPGEADLRGFEWRYLWTLCRGDQLVTLPGHKLTVTCADFSPDGTLLATGDQDGKVKIWKMPVPKLLITLDVTTNAAWSVAFTPDGKSLVTGYDRGVAFWSTESWRRQKDFPGEMAAISKTGDLLATAESSPFYWEPARTVKVFNWLTGELLGELDSVGRVLALSPDGKLLAVAGANRGIKIWDTASRKLLRDWPTKTPVWSLNFSPDGRELLSAGWSSDVSLWPLDGLSQPRIFSCGSFHAWSATFSKGGETIATTSSDQTVRLWDRTSLTLKSVLHGHDNEVWCAAFSPDGKFLATGGKDHNVMLWSLDVRPRGLRVMAHDRELSLQFSPDGKRLATFDPQVGNAALWDMDRITETGSITGRVVIGFSSDGKSSALFDASNLKLQFWLPDGKTLRKEVRLAGAPLENSPACCATSPDGRFFFAIDANGMIRVWNAETGQLLQTFNGPMPPIRNAILSSGGTYLAISEERDHFVYLFNCADGSERHLTGHIDFVSGLSFSPDGQTLATGSMDGTIRLWNVANGDTLASLSGHMEEVTDVAFSPDGRTLASLGHNEAIKLWHLPTRREVFSETMTNAGLRLQFSPDGRRLAVSMDDNTVSLLEAPKE